jgi:hypothetical protein
MCWLGTRYALANPWLGLTARAGIFYQGTVSGGGTSEGSVANTTIYDGNVNGTFNTMNLSSAGLQSSLADIKVTLNVSSSGYAEDFYAYLTYNGVLVPLLNRVGLSSGHPFGSPGQGLNNLVLSDAGSANVHTYVAGNGVLSGTYKADGLNISPLSSTASFNADGGSVTLDGVGTGFGGQNPNGQWTLFFSDVVGGGGNSTLQGWSLEITAVPEPVNVALGIFLLVCVGAGFVRRLAKAVRPTASR